MIQLPRFNSQFLAATLKLSSLTLRAVTLGIVALAMLSLSISGSDLFAEGHGKYLGVATCASSNCHGSAAPRKNSDVLENEYVTWQKHDKHSKAYEVLGNEQSRRIAYHLGIKAPERDPLCLNCHATYVKDAGDQGEKFRVEDGVGCESCHGAAEGWIKTHSESGVSHQDNLKNGLADIVHPVARAQMCADCHVGSSAKNVSHLIMGAGHPRISFELDTYSQIQPKHWQVDQDYIDRKRNYDSAEVWILGQVGLAEKMLKKLSNPKTSMQGVMPEFTNLYCYSCHHSLAKEEYKTHEYDGEAGKAHLNTAHLQMVLQALRALSKSSTAISPQLVERVSGQISDLTKSLYDGGQAKAAESLLKTLGTEVTPAIEASKLDDVAKTAMLKGVLAFMQDAPLVGYYEVAEQGAMAISSLSEALHIDRTSFRGALKDLYDALGSTDSYDPSKLRQVAKQLIASI